MSDSDRNQATIDRRLEVFISATSKDLGSIREMVTKAVMTIGYHPVVQESFPPDYRQVMEMLKAKIAACDAVIHIVGMRYGGEPKTELLPPGELRRSYTQLEAEFARKLGKKLYVFVCPEDFPYDEAHRESPEEPEKQELQRAWREHILSDRTCLYTKVRDIQELASKVRELGLEQERLRGVIRQDRRQWTRILLALTTVLALLAIGVGWGIYRLETMARDPESACRILRDSINKTADDMERELRIRAAGWQEIDQVRKERDFLLDDISRDIDRIYKGLDKDSHPIYKEAVQILQKEGVKSVLDFFQARKPALVQSIDFQVARANREKDELRKLLEVRQLEAITLKNNLRFEEAIKVYEGIIDTDRTWVDPRLDLADLLSERGEIVDPMLGNVWLRRAERLYRETLAILPEDKETDTWARTQMNLGIVLASQGERAAGAEAVRLLGEAVASYRSALKVYTKNSPQDWALTQNNLGLALASQGERAEGSEAVRLLGEAEAAFRLALEVRTKTRKELPQDWAVTQLNLGLALASQGKRAAGAEAVRLLGGAEAAYRSALEVFTPKDSPQLWAKTQMDLGIALGRQGERAEGVEAGRLLDKAVTAFRSALKVYTSKDLPQDWARTQLNLGFALLNQGERAAGVEAAGLLGEAEAAIRSALKVFTIKDSPQDWALAQMNLGNALRIQGERAAGAESARLLGKAVEAYRSALKVFTIKDSPQDWALAQMNLGNALVRTGERAAGAEAARLLGEAVAAYRSALKVYTPKDLPQDCAKTQMNLGIALWTQGERVAGAEATRLLAGAVTAYHSALEVFTLNDSPQLWAMAQSNLGLAIVSQSEQAAGGESVRLLDEAVAAYHAALEVFTHENSPQSWALTQMNLGNALLKQSKRAAGAEAARLLGKAKAAYHSALEVFTSKDSPQLWARTQTNLGTTLLNQGERAEGAEAVRLLGEAAESYRAVLKVFTRDDLPQDWAVTQNNLGFVLVSQSERAAGGEAARLLGEAAEAYRSALEVYTREDSPQDWVRLNGVLSYWLLFLKDFKGALEAADNALDQDPSQTWINIRRAHALLFLGRVDKAKAVYRQYARQDAGDGKTFAKSVLEDFDKLEAAGVTSPAMKTVRTMLKEAAAKPAP